MVALLSLAGAITCYLLVDAVLPRGAGGARLSLLLLSWRDFSEFDRVLMRVLPIVLLKALPGLEAPDAHRHFLKA